jgi:hypothetical protein
LAAGAVEDAVVVVLVVVGVVDAVGRGAAVMAVGVVVDEV